MHRNRTTQRSSPSGIAIGRGRPSAVDHGSPHKMPGASLSLGKSQAVRSGPTSRDIALGRDMAKRKGRSLGHDLSAGATLGVRKFAQGGHLGVEAPMERLHLSRKRDEKLETPHYAKGGHVEKSMRAMYEALHSHFENMPPMKKLGAKQKDVFDGEPHRAARRKSGGPLWIQGAINSEKKGALHRALNVPMDQKIPSSKLESAEHSRSPLTRKRARLAETLRGFHQKDR